MIQTIKDLVSAKADTTVALAREIWGYAELSYEETKSAAALIAALKQEGFTIEEGIADIPTAFTATFTSGSGKPVVGFLAEYDALSGLSQKAGCPVQEAVQEGGAGHGCGHNLLGAGCYAAAVALKDYLIKEKKDGTVIFFGCPAEEGAGSKQFIARAGYFDNVDFAYTWHPETVNEVGSRGSVAIMGANFIFDGIAAHAGGEPHLGRSALDAVELMNVGCNYLREHMIDAARIHYAYSDPGGTAPNVVQSHAVIKYEVRAPKVSQVQELFTRVVDVAKGAALMTGTKMKYEITMAFSDYVPNRTLGAVVDQCMRELGAPEWTEPDYRLAAEFLRTYPRTTMVGIREKLGYYFEPEELDAALEKPLDRIIQPQGDRLQFRLHRRGRRGLRHPHRHVPRGHRLPGQCGPLLAEHRLCLLRYRYEGHAAGGGDHDPGCHPHHGPAGGHRQGPGGTEAEKRRQLPLPPAGLRDASHRPLLSFTAFSRPCRSAKEPLLSNTSGPSAAWNAPDYKSKRPALSSRPFRFYSSSRNLAALSMAAAAFLMGNI